MVWFVITFSEYLGVVTNALETTQQSSQCTAAIEQATGELENRLNSSDSIRPLEKLFKLCDPLDVTDRLDVANLFETLAGNFEGVVQYNKDNRDFKVLSDKLSYSSLQYLNCFKNLNFVEIFRNQDFWNLKLDVSYHYLLMDSNGKSIWLLISFSF